MTNTESFLRGRIGISILSTQTVPFTLPVSVVPKNDNQFITISPDTENEEIFYYTTRTGTAGQQGTILVTARGYNKNDNTTDNSNYKEHKINDVFKGALNHIIINDKSSLSENNTFSGNNIFSKSIKVPVYGTTALRDSAITSPTNGMLCYITDINEYTVYKGTEWIVLSTFTQTYATRTTTTALANNGELFRNSGDNNSLYFKDNGGNIIKILDDTTNKIPTASLELTKASDAEVAAGTDDVKYITSKQLHDNLKDSFGARIGKSFGTNYLATESGIVTAYAKTTNSGYSIFIAGYIGLTNPANTQISGHYESEGYGYGVSTSFPVVKGEYYRVDISTSNSIGYSYYTFTPNK